MEWMNRDDEKFIYFFYFIPVTPNDNFITTLGIFILLFGCGELR